MTVLRLRALLALILMVAAVAAGHFLRPTAHLADQLAKIDLEQLFPKRFGDWRMDDRQPIQLVSPDTQAVINMIYAQTLSRTYVNPQGVRVMLSVAYGGDQSDATRAHRPEVCYPAQGFQIVSSSETMVPTATHAVHVRQLVAESEGRVEPISYWVVTGERVTLSGTQQKLAQLAYSRQGLIPDGMLVRVSTISRDRSSAFAIQAQFIAEMASAIPQSFRSRVIGKTGNLGA